MAHQVRCATLSHVQFGVFTSANSNNDETYAALVGYSLSVIEYIMKAAGIWVVAFIYETLYNWIFAQRAAHRRKMPSLTRLRIESLESLAGWSWHSHSEKLSRTKSVPKGRRNQ